VTVELKVLDDPAAACSAMLLGPMLGGGNVVLTGGSTPGGAYHELANTLQAIGRGVGEATVWFSDERCVAPDDELSNYRLVERALLEPLSESGSPRVKRMEGELGPHEGAERYERELRTAGPLPFDLMLLGLGADGHCASLFPDQQSLNERSRLAVGVEEAGLEPFVPRVSLSLPALASAKRIVFLVTGESKADAVAAAFGKDARPSEHMPASLLVPLAGELTVLLDPAAAAKL
jgi:6-phosphogluconolactonase